MGIFSFLFGKKKKDDALAPEQELKQQELPASSDQDDQSIVDNIVAQERAEERFTAQEDNESVFAEQEQEQGLGAEGETKDLHSSSIDSIADQVEAAEKKEQSCDSSTKEESLNPQDSSEGTSESVLAPTVASEEEQAESAQLQPEVEPVSVEPEPAPVADAAPAPAEAAPAESEALPVPAVRKLDLSKDSPFSDILAAEQTQAEKAPEPKAEPAPAPEIVAEVKAPEPAKEPEPEPEVVPEPQVTEPELKALEPEVEVKAPEPASEPKVVLEPQDTEPELKVPAPEEKPSPLTVEAKAAAKATAPAKKAEVVPEPEAPAEVAESEEAQIEVEADVKAAPVPLKKERKLKVEDEEAVVSVMPDIGPAPEPTPLVVPQERKKKRSPIFPWSRVDKAVGAAEAKDEHDSHDGTEPSATGDLLREQASGPIAATAEEAKEPEDKATEAKAPETAAPEAQTPVEEEATTAPVATPEVSGEAKPVKAKSTRKKKAEKAESAVDAEPQVKAEPEAKAEPEVKAEAEAEPAAAKKKSRRTTKKDSADTESTVSEAKATKSKKVAVEATETEAAAAEAPETTATKNEEAPESKAKGKSSKSSKSKSAKAKKEAEAADAAPEEAVEVAEAEEVEVKAKDVEALKAEEVVPEEAAALAAAEVAPEAAEAEPAKEAEAAEQAKAEEKQSFFSRLKRSRDNFAQSMSALIRGRKIDDDLYDELETDLLTADLGGDTTYKVIDRLREESRLRDLSDASALRKNLKQILTEILDPCQEPLVLVDHKPFVILMVGVNGAGKTTTIGKLARKYQDQGFSVMLAAGDTFRAAAVEQLKEWGERSNVPVIAQATGSDSASVIYDAVNAARARDVDVLICDTAGRLQNKDNLMEELRKIVRVMKKIDPMVPHEVLLVLDGTTGQNAISQVKAFNEAVKVTGLVLTKLDGSAKGGVVFTLADLFQIPIRYVGIGEKAEDLREFKVEPFVDALIDDKAID